MVAERDLVASQLVGVLVERAPTQPGAERAERVARLDLLLHRQVDPGAPHLERVPLASEVVLDQVGPESRETLVNVQREQVEPDGGATLDQSEEIEERPGVLAAGNSDEDAVSGLDQPEVPDGLAEPRQETPVELLVFAHGGRRPPGGMTDCSPPCEVTSTEPALARAPSVVLTDAAPTTGNPAGPRLTARCPST